MFKQIFVQRKSIIHGLKIVQFSTNKTTEKHYQLVIIGAGTGGCTIAAKFQKIFQTVAVIEPKDNHYYQPMFTLVGAGVKHLKQSVKPLNAILPKSVKWLKESVSDFVPETNSICLKSGHRITYDYLVVAMGLQLNFNEIPGLIESLNDPFSGVCTNYSPKYVEKTFKIIQNVNSGNVLFTFPNTPIKCPGAPQKICYLADDYFRKHNLRQKTNLTYFTSLPVIFGAKKYADSLWEVAKTRDIDVKLRTNLTEVKYKQKVAVFQNLDRPQDPSLEIPFSMLHVTPPMSTPDVLRNQKQLVNEAGFLDVDKSTLQHRRYPNIFGIGDCISTPNPKTAASIAVQSKVLFKNLNSFSNGKPLSATYNGYASCPLVTSYQKCILAEFDYDLQPLETFPFNQGKESRFAYLLKTTILPTMYWKLMLNGYWNGPAFFRNLWHFKFKKN